MLCIHLRVQLLFVPRRQYVPLELSLGAVQGIPARLADEVAIALLGVKTVVLTRTSAFRTLPADTRAAIAVSAKYIY